MTTPQAEDTGPLLPAEPLASQLAQALAFMPGRAELLVCDPCTGPAGVVGGFTVTAPDQVPARVTLTLAPAAGELLRIDTETLDRLDTIRQHLPAGADLTFAELIAYVLDMLGLLAGIAGQLTEGRMFLVGIEDLEEDQDEPQAPQDDDAAAPVSALLTPGTAQQ